jgi:hypothetical protein
MTDDPFTASAKATEEIAKTAGKAVDAGAGFGRFLVRIFGPALEQFGDSLEDQVRYWRKGRLRRLEVKYEEACKDLGEVKQPIPVDPKFAIALLEAASLEDDDDLQDMYARLLANATTDGTGVEARRTFVSILQDLTPLDVHLLSMIYRAPTGPAGTVRTARLPDEYVKAAPGVADTKPVRRVEVSLWNLVRAGCIESAGGWDGTATVAVVTLTALGSDLVEACTIGHKDNNRDAADTRAAPTITLDIVRDIASAQALALPDRIK